MIGNLLRYNRMVSKFSLVIFPISFIIFIIFSNSYKNSVIYKYIAGVSFWTFVISIFLIIICFFVELISNFIFKRGN